MTTIQKWVSLIDVSEIDASSAIEEFSRLCREHAMDGETADELWAASQIVLCYLLKELGELPERDSLPDSLPEFAEDD